MPYYKLGNKKGQTIIVKASTSDAAKRAALAAGLSPDEYETSWTGRPRRDYTIIKRSDKKIENPSLVKTWRIIQISTNAELGKISAPSSGGAIKNYINKVGLPLSDKKYLQAIEVKKNPSLAKTGKWIKARAVRIVGKTLQILK